MTHRERPKPGTPEYERWMLDRARERNKKLFSEKGPEFDERGVISGGRDAIEKDDRKK